MHSLRLPMHNTLKEICAVKAGHVALQQEKVSLNELKEMAAVQMPPKGFAKALKQKQQAKEIGLIAEVKKASPSKGIIREDFDPVAIAHAYAEGGATCVSVLTDAPYFQGSDDIFRAVRTQCALPMIRKDFMIDPYQMLESRAMGADAVLLILAALDDKTGVALEACAHELGMDVLLEVHNEDEMNRALRHYSSKLLGVNNRNLKTLEVDLLTAKNLANHYPDDYIKICESGIAGHEDVKAMQHSGYQCFLVGETLMRQKNVLQATQALLGA